MFKTTEPPLQEGTDHNWKRTITWKYGHHISSCRWQTPKNGLIHSLVKRIPTCFTWQCHICLKWRMSHAAYSSGTCVLCMSMKHGSWPTSSHHKSSTDCVFWLVFWKASCNLFVYLLTCFSASLTSHSSPLRCSHLLQWMWPIWDALQIPGV